MADRLAKQSDADFRLIMRQFKLPVGEDDYWGDTYAYALNHTEDADDSTLTALHRYFFPDEGESKPTPDEGNSPWRAGAFRLFVTHTTAEKRRASVLSVALASADVHAFVAHETLEPTREWEDTIESALRTCDALCAIWTPDLVKSCWCDQEIGIAVAQRKLVVPLKVGSDPHGFIAKYQAIHVDENGEDVSLVADRVLRALIMSPTTRFSVAPHVVSRYAASSSVESARTAFELLKLIPRDAWTPSMIERVERASVENASIKRGSLAERPVRRLSVAAKQLLDEIRPKPAPPAQVSADDDIPF